MLAWEVFSLGPLTRPEFRSLSLVFVTVCTTARFTHVSGARSGMPQFTVQTIVLSKRTVLCPLEANGLNVKLRFIDLISVSSGSGPGIRARDRVARRGIRT